MKDELPSVIHLANISKIYGDLAAVQDVSLRIPKGQIVGFVGPNGAGKTTTISLIMGFIGATKGRVTLFGNQEVTPASAHATHRRIGFIGGDMDLPENLTGRQYLNFVGAAHKADKQVFKQLVNKLKPELKPAIKHLSRGNKQKIALIAALQHKPELIILDEPTSGLDPLMQEVFLSTIKEEAARGATVLMSSHILSEVSSICDRVVFIKQGRVILDKPITDIKAEAGKMVTVTADKLTIEDLKHSLPASCKIIKEQEVKLVVLHNDDIRLITRWLGIKPINDLTIVNRDLDDIFHELYQSDDTKGTKK